MKSHNNTISDGVEISSCNLNIRKDSIAMSRPDDIQRDIVHDSGCPVAAQRDDDESVVSSVSSSASVIMISQQRVSGDTAAKLDSKDKANRRHVFDEMYEYFRSNQHAQSPGAKSGLTPPSNDEMWFGDLDFSLDLAALGLGDHIDHTPTEQ